MVEQSENKISELDITTVYPNPDQPRKAFNDEALHELSESIEKHGIIQPITVNKTENGYMIVAGERRYRASLLAGRRTIPAIIKSYDDRQVKEIALLENLQREDLNPIEEASAIKRLMDEFDLTQDDVAERLGKSRSAIANSLRLLNLSPEVTRLVSQNKLSAGHARSLVTLPFVKQSALARKAVAEGWSVREIEKAVRDFNAPTEKRREKPEQKQSPELRELVERLQRDLGTKVAAIGNDNKGRLYIDYFTRDDLDRISEILDYIEEHEEDLRK